MSHPASSPCLLNRVSQFLIGVGCSFLLLASAPIMLRAQGIPQDRGTEQRQQSQPADAVAQTAQANPPGPIRIFPVSNGSQALKSSFAPPGAHLTYWGGPVMSQVHVVAVFWGSQVNPVITGPNSIDQFFTDITKSQYFDLLSEYSTTGLTGSGTPATSSNQTINHGVFDGKFTIAPGLCATASACALTDLQIQTELLRQVASGALPQPVTDTQGNTNTFYMIYFPAGVSINAGGALSCASGGFCAYHSSTGSRSLPYGVQPDFAPPSGCSLGCGRGTLFQQVTTVTSHELSEAVTNPLVGAAVTTAPPLAWYDPDPVANPLAEIGDICIGNQVNVTAGGNSYAVQNEFSNVQNDCVAAPPVFALSAPTDAGPGTAFNATVSLQSSNGPFNLFAYTGTVHFTSSDPAAVLPADYTYTAADQGSHAFSFTLSTLGTQTITATDVRATAFTGTASVSVNRDPDLAIAKSHTGNFNVGQTGATYSILVSNAGRGPTTGTVTVSDSLPTGLTATAIAGTGWTCTLGTLTCTRADVLAVNGSYPPITLTVNVAQNAASPVTNTATVSGGGEKNTANDTARDATIIQAPDLTVFMSHFGPVLGTFFQGETGAPYSISVTNSGSSATFGPVTVVATLPPTGLTAKSIGGTGWTCTLATLTCTRSDSLAAFTPYPVITLTVDVAANAPANVVSSATVSGGGELNLSNDLAQDFTTIVPPPTPDLSIGAFHTGTVILGQSTMLTIGVQNPGTAASSGTVTVVDTLPAGLTATAIAGTGWNCDLPSLTCTRADSVTPFNGSFPTITINVSVTAASPATVTNVATVSGGGDSNLNNNTSSDVIALEAPTVDLIPSFFNFNRLVQEENGTLFTIFAVNQGNIPSTGTVNVTVTLSPGLNITAINGTGWNCSVSTLSCSRSDALSPSFNYPQIDFIGNVPKTTTNPVTVTVTVSGGGDSVPANNTFSTTVQVTPLLAVFANSGPVTLTAGQTATYFLAISSLTNDLTTLTCGPLPPGTVCGFNPPSFTGGGNFSFTISTTSRTASVFGQYDVGGKLPWLWLVPLLAAGVFALTFQSGRGRQRLRPALGAAFVSIALFIVGCGGGGKSSFGSTAPPGTPAGTYTVVVTATNASTTASTNVTLVVR